MDWLQIGILLVLAFFLLRFIRKMLFKVIWIAVIVVIILYFFTDVNLILPW